MREFHHVGVPTTQKHDNEAYLPDGKVYITPVEDSPYAIEWLRFEPDSPMPEQLKTTTHLAFKVDDIQAEMEGKEVLLEPFKPMESLTVAFIMHEGVPVELMQEG